MVTKQYNTTQLTPERSFERHVFHRDMFAHYFRWTHVMKVLAKQRANGCILDFGCGSGQLMSMLYHNMFIPNKYVGVDVRPATIKGAQAQWSTVDRVKNVVSFVEMDLVKENAFLRLGNDWDVVTCFEVAEHVQKKNVPALLSNIASCMNANTTLLLSTPNFDSNVGPASNHTVNGEVCELEHGETAKFLYDAGLVVVKKYGTFASMRDIEPMMTSEQRSYYDAAKEYYDPNLLSCFMAFSFPERARNCLWVCKKASSIKKNEEE
jgi:2-polyprenyl-3-methyl-5-hydroxy-6-metoxy-1,4-benzoquinol methylase